MPSHRLGRAVFRLAGPVLNDFIHLEMGYRAAINNSSFLNRCPGLVRVVLLHLLDDLCRVGS